MSFAVRAIAQLRPHPDFQGIFQPLEPGQLERLSQRMAAGERFAPLLVTAQDEILAGVEHWEAAQLLGWQEISVVVAPPLTRSQLRALMVAENVRSREVRQAHLARGMNNFFDMEPLRPQGGW